MEYSDEGLGGDGGDHNNRCGDDPGDMMTGMMEDDTQWGRQVFGKKMEKPTFFLHIIGKSLS